ncbi:MAG: hypothetical protein KDJ47_15340 [Hyphomicrobiaceae bacterium]|nr:hypothetical protein [Hyphomicrobiaceae bacterium]
MLDCSDSPIARGEDWQPLRRALAEIIAEHGDYDGPVKLWLAIKNGYIPVIGKHGNGREFSDYREVTVSELQDYQLLGAFEKPPCELSDGPLLIRDEAPLPESHFPRTRSAHTKAPQRSKTFAHTDYWFDLRHNQRFYEAWKLGGPEAVDALLTAASPLRFLRKKQKRTSKANAELACEAWLIEEMNTWLAKDVPHPHDRKAVWRDRAPKQFDKISGKGFVRAWANACKVTGSGWDAAGRPRKTIVAKQS